jgi:hypothetical protein
MPLPAHDVSDVVARQTAADVRFRTHRQRVETGTLDPLAGSPLKCHAG